MSNIVYYHEEPPGFESKLIQFVLGLLGMKKRMKSKVLKNKYSKIPAKIPRSLKRKYHVAEDMHEGRKVWTICRKNKKSDTVVLYFHGGAYYGNITRLHWSFIEQLLNNADISIVIPDYPLAPEYNCAENFSFVEKLYAGLLKTHISRRIVFMGDSAGAGIALGLAQKIKQDQKQQPDHIILLSPWLDVSMSNPELLLYDEADKIINIDALKAAGKNYAGEFDVRDHRVSPLYGDLSGLGMISIFTGTNDLLIADARMCRKSLESSGIVFNYFEYPGMFHDWMLITRLKESRDVILKIAGILF
jgi:acetyl esterase/lipase